MGRPLRLVNAGAWYHVLNRGVDRHDIFVDVRDRLEFERLLGVAHDRFGIKVHTYCQMTNHYHLLLECPDGRLSEAMHLLGSVYVRHFNERHGRDGPLFKDRFYAKRVDDDDYLVRLVGYIHRNPLAFLSAAELRSYKWASYRALLGDRRAPRWMATEAVLSLFGDDVDAFERFILGEADPIGPPSRPDGWRDAIELMLDERLSATPRQGLWRTIALLVLDRLDPSVRDDVLASLAFPSPAAERMARSRARRRLDTNPDLANVIDGVLRLVA